MGNSKEFYENLKKHHKIKKKEIKIYKRKERIPQNQLIRETSLFKGSVWGVQDLSVPFDNKRKEDHYKASLRPTLILETPNIFTDYSVVSSAPGTSKVHKVGEGFPSTLKAEVPPENLEKTTYFLLEYSWFAIQKTMNKKLTELTSETMGVLNEMIEGLEQ